jgi:hypothetical protein
MSMRYFIDTDEHVWSVKENGQTNLPYPFEVIGDAMVVYGCNASNNCEQTISHKYPLYPTLTSLSDAIEHDTCRRLVMPRTSINDSLEVAALKEQCQRLINDRNEAWFTIEELKEKLMAAE